MSAKKPVYEGKAKKLFEGPEPGTLIQHFKDDATAFNNEKKGTISGKGIINNRVSEFLMSRLMEVGIPTHFIKGLNMREQLVMAAEIIPIEVIVRNYATGSFAKRFHAEDGEPIGAPLVEYCLKSDKMGDPFIAEEHVFAFDLCEPVELEEIRHFALRINDYLSGLFYGVGIRLVDMKLEFGRVYELDEATGATYVSIVLADEISPDTCRLWDIESGDKLDKDRFRKDMDNIEESYREVAQRLGLVVSADVVEIPSSKKGTQTTTKTAKKPAAKRKPATRKPTTTGKKKT